VIGADAAKRTNTHKYLKYVPQSEVLLNKIIYSLTAWSHKLSKELRLHFLSKRNKEKQKDE